MTTISIVIPARNRAAVIARAIDSVYAQSLLPDEIVVVDDGSDDDGATIAAALAAARPAVPLRIIRLDTQGGAPNARNRGVAAAAGEWIAFLDSDDAFAPGKLVAVAGRLRGGTAAVFTDTVFVGADGTTETMYGGAAPALDDLRYRNVIGGCSAAVVRKAAFGAVGGFDTTLSSCQDWDLWLRLADHGRLEVIVAPLTLYHFDGAARISRNPDGIVAGHLALYERIRARHAPGPALAELRRYQRFHLAQTRVYFTGDRRGTIGPALRNLVRPHPRTTRRSSLHLLLTAVGLVRASNRL